MPISMEWFISRLSDKEMAGAAIFSILAPRPSDPAALWDGMNIYSDIEISKAYYEMLKMWIISMFILNIN